MEKIKLFFSKNWLKVISFVLILAFMICSVTVLAKTFTDPHTYIKTIQSIDEKKLTVLSVSAAIAGSSTVLSAIPDDATTPLAEELMDLSSYLVIVVCILVLEKSLLTVFGSVSCYVLFPIACVFALAFFIRKKQIFIAWAIKFAVLALALLMIVPVSMKLSDYIYEVNQLTIEESTEEVLDTVDPETETESNEDLPWYSKLWDAIESTANKAVEKVEQFAQKAIETGKKALNKFTDAVAVFIIAYCAIPVFVVFLFLWIFRILFGLNTNVNFKNFNLKKTGQKASDYNVG